MKKPYKETVSTMFILEDGWARGFNILQTYQEVHQMGRSIELEAIQDLWDKFDNAYKYFEKGNFSKAKLLHSAALTVW